MVKSELVQKLCNMHPSILRKDIEKIISTFIEEIIPGFDLIPTFTLMWLYTYVLKKSPAKTTIEV